MRISHVLDTSAILAHYFNEPGADVVGRLWQEEPGRVAVSAVTVAELKGRLDLECEDPRDAETAAHTYLDELTVCLPVDRATAELARQLRNGIPGRLPLVDALIAATARQAGAVLVHKDAHMSRIPRELLAQVVLGNDPRTNQLEE